MIRCGEAGHNIRNRPSLKGTPIGLLCRTNRIKALTHASTDDGDWLKLEQESVETYCEKDGEAWTLARSKSDIVYLEQEAESEYETDTETDDDDDDTTRSGSSMTEPVGPSFPIFGAPAVNEKGAQQIQQQAQQQPLPLGFSVFGQPFGVANNAQPGGLFGAGNNAQPGGLFGLPVPLPVPGLFGLPPRVDNARSQGAGGFVFEQQQVVGNPNVRVAPANEIAPANPFKFRDQNLFANVPPPGPLFGGFGGGLRQPAGAFGPPAGAFGPPAGAFGPPAGGLGVVNPAPQPGPFQFSVSPSGKEASGDEDESKKDKPASPFSFGAPPPAASAFNTDKAPSSSVFSLGPSPQRLKSDEGKSKNRGRGKKGRSKSPARFGARAEKGNTTSDSKVRKALSPAVAKCMRAVFTAFMWHEGITHDAMACASYLKFHPELMKDTGKQKSMENESDKEPEKNIKELNKPGEITGKDEDDKKGDDLKQKESRETISVESTETAVAESSETSEESLQKKDSTEKETKTELKLPATLRHLVTFWDELVGGIQLATSKKLPQPKVPELKLRAKIVERPETEAPDRKDKPKGKPKAAGPGQTICELCDEPFQNPVTYHMKRAHPGCGKHAAGQGYNSGGTFCGGWAGNCGDGGHGGSTWYLMCNSCHDKYLDQKKEQMLAQDKRTKQAGIIIKMVSGKPKFKNPTSTDSHNIITDNCKFLLELESASGSKVDDVNRMKSPDAPQPGKTSWEHNQQPDQSMFPRQFQYLRGISVPSPSESLLSKALAIAMSETKKPMIPRSASIEERVTMTLDRGGKLRNQEPPKTKDPVQRPSLLRSISVAVPETIGDIEDEEQNRAIKRKHSPLWSPLDDMRKQFSSGPINLVERMSPKLYKLVQRQQTEADEDKQSSPSERALKRPLLAFVCQQLDLDCIRRSMTKALVHCACRVHAMQSFEYHLCRVTQTAALHDLMWFFAASLTPPLPPESDAEEKKEGEKKEKEEVDLTMGEHPTDELVAAGDGLVPLTNAFHSLLQTISDLMAQLPQGSAVQQMSMRSWCIHFHPRDHTFLHRSCVFSRINQFLTRVDEEEAHTNGALQTPDSLSVVLLPEIVITGKVTSSSRPAMLDSLTDDSTETFWESGDEDKHRSRWLQVAFDEADVRPEVVYIHIDNNRDSGVS